MEGLKENITPRTFDRILLSVFLGDEVVLEPLVSPISLDPLYSGLALIVALLWIGLVQFKQIGRQIQSSIATALPATLPYRLFKGHNVQTERLQDSEKLPMTCQARACFRRVNMMLQVFCK